MPRDKKKYLDAATRLKSLREAKGISVQELAEKLGVSTARYRTWEKIFGPLPQRQYGDAINRILSDFDTESRWPEADDSPPSSGNLNFNELGNRAAKRRESLNFSKAYVAGKIGVSDPTLKSWETSLPERHRGDKEDAWEDVLYVPRGWLRHLSFSNPESHMKVFDFTDSEFNSVADEIRAVGSWLSRQHAATRTWNFDVLSEQERRRAIMFADRYGVSGEDKTILQVIGDRFGLTRERVRQIIDGMTNRARGGQFNLPKLAQLKAAVSTAELCAVTEFQAAYRDLLGGVSLADADRFAREILGFSVASISERAFGHANSSLQPMIIEPGTQEIVIAVRAASLRMIRSCGAAHILFVTGLVSEAIGKAVALASVRGVLFAIDGMEWLTQDEDWFWLGPDTANNRVLESVRKVLAAASRKVDVEDLHQAVCRSRRAYYKSDIRAQPPEIEVPQEVLREILLRVPWLSVIQMNDFILTEDVAVEDVLNSSELAIVRVIEEHGGAAARQVFNKRFVDTGMFSVPNLQIVLTSSPVIRQLGYGIYGVRGTELPQKAFSAAHASVTRFASPVDMKEDGWCEFTFSISEAGLRNNIADIPRGVLKVIPRGIYSAEGVATGTISLGTIPSAPNRTSGLVVLLRKADIQPGERLLFRIHPESMRAVISRVEQLEPS
ncbi:MAG: helix-turn-helix domain-containing protein [Thiobacillus sp.]|nr:helix-turn-helix domain-containing protein [Thiobacillus sp.]